MISRKLLFDCMEWNEKSISRVRPPGAVEHVSTKKTSWSDTNGYHMSMVSTWCVIEDAFCHLLDRKECPELLQDVHLTSLLGSFVTRTCVGEIELPKNLGGASWMQAQSGELLIRRRRHDLFRIDSNSEFRHRSLTTVSRNLKVWWIQYSCCHLQWGRTRAISKTADYEKLRCSEGERYEWFRVKGDIYTLMIVTASSTTS